METVGADDSGKSGDIDLHGVFVFCWPVCKLYPGEENAVGEQLECVLVET